SRWQRPKMPSPTRTNFSSRTRRSAQPGTHWSLFPSHSIRTTRLRCPMHSRSRSS
ncbi:hypothetical protein IWW51_006765, partial [Coemansia sp. RSA 2702]